MTNEAQAGRAFIESAIQLKAAASAVGISNPADLDRVLSLGTAVANYLGAAPLRALKGPRFEKVCGPAGHVITRDTANRLEWAIDDFSGKRMTFDEAKEACEGLSLHGGGWRLPTIQELLTVVDYERSEPACDPEFFPKANTDYYYRTSTPYKPVSGYAWGVNFGDGYSSALNHGDGDCVRAVRASQS